MPRVCVSVMSAVGVIAMRVRVGHRDFAPLVATAGELDTAAEKHQAEQSRDVDQFADKVAEGQTQDEVAAAFRRSNDSPNQHPDRSDQHDRSDRPGPITPSQPDRSH